MFIVVRVRWEATSPGAVWSDEAMHAWLDPNREWSLAHCWSRSSFRHLTLNPYYLTPVVVAPGDPRTNPSYAHLQPRDALMQGVMDFVPAEVISDNAEAIASGRARFLFWFAQKTDQFGSSIARGGVPAPFAVCDILGLHSAICQEVGHAYDFDHELADLILPDGRYADYGSAYSFMSAISDEEYARPPVKELPVGQPHAHSGNMDPQTLVGPQLALAHLHVHNVGDFVNPESCITKEYKDFENDPVQITVHSVDAALNAWPGTRLPALIVIPQTPVDDRGYYIEFRTKDHYDSNIAGPALVMHSYRRNMWDGEVTKDRLVYEGSVIAGSGDTDMTSRSGVIGIKAHFHQDGTRAIVTISKADAIPAGLGLTEGPDYERKEIGQGAWKPKYARPCPFTPGRTYSARSTWYRTECRIVVSASGYATPLFRFYLAGQELTDALANSVTLNALVYELDEATLDTHQVTRNIVIRFTVAGAELILETNEPFTGSLTLGASVEESNDGSNRVNRANLFEFSFRNKEITWDPSWYDDVRTCMAKRPRHVPEVTFPWEEEGPRPNWHRRIFDIIEAVDETSPAVAHLLVQGLSHKADLDRRTLRKLNSRWKPLG